MNCKFMLLLLTYRKIYPRIWPFLRFIILIIANAMDRQHSTAGLFGKNCSLRSYPDSPNSTFTQQRYTTCSGRSANEDISLRLTLLRHLSCFTGSATSFAAYRSQCSLTDWLVSEAVVRELSWSPRRYPSITLRSGSSCSATWVDAFRTNNSAH